MTVVRRAAPVRRGPLSEWHRRRGARMVPAGEWPATYGDVQRERSAARERVAIVDAGPFDRIALDGALEAPPPAPRHEPGCVTEGRIDGRDAELWTLTDRSSLLVAPGADAASAASLAAAAAALGARAADVSSRYATFILAGPRSAALLEEVCPVDLRAVAPREIAFGPLARVTATVARMGTGAVAAFTVLVARDEAEYLWESLLRVGERHGIVPAGAAALAGDR